MVEGHQCHRVAHAHRKLLLGHAFMATSPNKRFLEGAAAISGQPLTRIEVHGKNLFYFFGPEHSPVVVHIHFGMSGAFKTLQLPGPEPTETTRLRIENRELGVVGLVSAMTLQHGGMDYYLAKAAKLGPDPLREDADPEVVWAKVASSKKSIGLLLMEQSVMAGVGNIYRAEILFKAGVHPEQPGYSVSRQAFDEVWRHSVLLLQRGFQTGSILTVDPQDAKAMGKPWTRRYIYNHKSCGRCGGTVRSWDMAGRTAYACEGCQPLVAAEKLPPARAKALKAAKQAQEFVSHCAPEDPSDLPPSKMTLPKLRAALAALALPSTGRKAELAARLTAAQAASAVPASAAREQGQVLPGAARDAATSPTAAADVVPAGGAKRQPKARRAQAAADVAGADVAEAVADAKVEELGRGLAVPTPNPRPRRARAPAPAPAGQLSPAMAAGAPRAQRGPGVLVGKKKGEDAALVLEGGAALSPEVYTWQQYSPASGSVPPAAGGAPQQAGGATAAATGGEAAGGPGEGSPAGRLAGKRRRRGGVVPGTKVVGEMASAEEAAEEKALAGEGRNVEHVALVTDGAESSTRRRRRARA